MKWPRTRRLTGGVIELGIVDGLDDLADNLLATVHLEVSSVEARQLELLGEMMVTGSAHPTKNFLPVDMFATGFFG
jgi:hypothetical protein